MLGWWNLRRASAIGAGAGLVALLVWPFYRVYGEVLEWPFLAVTGAAGLCGASILLITIADSVRNRRGSRIRAVRGFDYALGALLLALSLLQIQDVQSRWLP